MAENGQTQNRLREAIAAAQRGEKLTARRLLQQVLAEDRNNEVAWMWMASVVDTADERRACLERALKINPNNTRAREALRRMGVNVPDAAAAGPGRPAPEPRAIYTRTLGGGRSNRTLYFAIAGAVAIVLLAIVALSLVPRGPTDAQVAQTATAFAVAQIPQVFEPQPTIDPQTFTATPFIGATVTALPAESTLLPPTFTPTATNTPPATPLPTATPIPLEQFSLVFTALQGDGGQPSLFRANADGTGLEPLTSDFGDQPVFSPSGDRIAFVRLVPGQATGLEAEATPSDAASLIPQLFVAPADDPADAQQVTQATGASMSRPAWTPDGETLIYTSDQDGDSELYSIAARGGEPTKLTENDFDDTDPAVSPDGRTIVYASDQSTPGSPELFSLLLTGGSPVQLTNASGSSTAPAFSPDGQRITFISDRRGDTDVWVMDANGQRPFQVTIDDGDAEDRSPVWTPDGMWIAFVSNREGGNFQVYLISPDGNTLLPLPSGDSNVQAINMRPASLPG